MMKKSLFHPTTTTTTTTTTTCININGACRTSPNKSFVHTNNKRSFCCLLLILGIGLVGLNLYWQVLGPSSSFFFITQVGGGGRRFDDTTTRNVTRGNSRKITSHSDDKLNVKVASSTGVVDDRAKLHQCGLLPQPEDTIQTLRDQLDWISYQQTPEEKQDYFKRVYACSAQFKPTHVVEDGLNSTTLFVPTEDGECSGSRVLETTLICGDDDDKSENSLITQEKIQQFVSQSNNVLFVGDSVLKQQYFVFLCMLEPHKVSPQTFATYQEEPKWSRYQYDYKHQQHPNGTSMTTTTSIRYESVGKFWDWQMPELWHGAFPQAVADFSLGDAIVMDSSRHFNTIDVEWYEKVLRYIRTKAQQSKATIYYMEPTPQEWPTSNGMFLQACYWYCTCQLLTDLALQGNAIPNDPEVNMTSSDTISGRTYVGALNNKLYEPYAKVFSPNKAAKFTLWASENDLDCLPDCVPATWRVDLVRSILLSSDTTTTSQGSGGASTSSQSHDRDHHHHRVDGSTNLQVVPIYWQLVGRKQHSSKLIKGDCTHRSLDAIVFMNEQLIRSMMINNQGKVL